MCCGVGGFWWLFCIAFVLTGFVMVVVVSLLVWLLLYVLFGGVCLVVCWVAFLFFVCFFGLGLVWCVVFNWFVVGWVVLWVKLG